jgi:hypothetical protein
VALLPFHLDRQEGRNRRFQCEVKTLGDKGERFLALNVKESELIPARTVKKSGGTAQGSKEPKAGAEAAAGKQPEPPAGAK